MSNERLTQDERISALMDGQLTGEAFEQAVQVLTQRDEARARWYAYHLVGDVMRSPELAADSVRDSAFMARFRLRLQGEVIRPSSEGESALFAKPASPSNVGLLVDARKESANDAMLRWRWVAGFASVAAVTVLAWHLMAGVGAPAGAPVLAQSQTPLKVGRSEPSAESLAMPEAPQVMIRDPQLDQWLQAHQQLGGTSALQMPAGFLRNATYERGTR